MSRHTVEPPPGATPRTSVSPHRIRPASSPGAALTAVMSAVVLLVSLGWLAAPSASAHAFLVSSSPAEGAMLTDVPRDVVLTFSGDLEPRAQVTVMGPDGAPLHSGRTTVSASTLSQRLSDQSGGVPGLYTIAYTATSVDGHEITGQLGFYIGGAESGGTGAGADAAAAGPPGLVERSDEPDSSVPTLVWVLLVAVVVLLAAGVTWVLRRRSTRPTQTPATRPMPPRARARAKAAAGRSRGPR